MTQSDARNLGDNGEVANPAQTPDGAAAPDRSGAQVNAATPADAAASGTATAPDGDAGADEGGETSPTARGMQVLTAEEFSLTGAVGGIRGVIEALAPGLVFVVVYLLTFELTPTLIASSAVAIVAVAARLFQRTPVTQAFSGMLGVAIGVLWAWRSGEASDYFLFGLITNAAYLLACVASILLRWPMVGVVVEAMRLGLGSAQAEKTGNPFAGFGAWRADRVLVRRYALATWFWVALFGIRLAVQTPLYLEGTDAAVGWLGAARLAMGIPLWALTIWASWVVVKSAGAATPTEAAPTLPR